MTAPSHLPCLKETGLPLRTRLVLLALLGSALCIVLLLWRDYTARVIFQLQAANSPQIEKKEGARPLGISATAEPARNSEPDLKPTAEALALAEIDVLKKVTEEDPASTSGHEVGWFKPYIESDNSAIRAAGTRALAPYYAKLDLTARSAARASAEAAADLVAEQKYTSALEVLDHALNALPTDAPWSEKHGRPQIQSLIGVFAKAREDERARAFVGLDASVRAGDADALAKLKSLLNHNEPSFKQAALEINQRVSVENAKQTAERRQRDAVARVAWLDFYRKFDIAVAAGNLNEAESMCSPQPADALRTGGVGDPQKMLDGCKGDVLAIRALYDAVLESARKSSRAVDLHLRRGRVEGTLEGAEGRQLQVALNGGGKVGVKVENLSSSAILSILGQPNPALWAMMGSENPDKAAALFASAYASIKTEVPYHWAQRFKLDKFKALDLEVGQKLHDLSDALEASKPEEIAAALDAVRPSIAALEEYESLSEDRRKVVSAAEKIVGHAVRKKLVLQNGLQIAGLPAPVAGDATQSPPPPVEYSGISTDQISDYRDSVRKTDIGVKWGLKLGASGGLQRILIRFDGLEGALNNARVKHASLELYQIDSPQSAGSVVGMFRLKRAWVPESGTWLGYSAAKGADWSVPGASGETDAEAKEDALVTLDQKKAVWRSFNVTQYVQDILGGKAQNNGFLMRVVNGEPDHHVRFYPETDLDGLKDKSLRPRLVLEIERE